MLKPILAGSLDGLLGIRHGFFTREGGVSSGLYAGLNCGFGSADDPAHVAENRTRVARHLHPAGSGVLTVHQVHSATAVTVSGDIPRENLPKADALVTTTRGLVIGVLAADCAPVLFADPEAHVVGAAHAGWRGAVGGVLESTIALMETLGARRARIRAAIGPCINQRSYEVGPEFEAQVLSLDPENSRFFAPLGPEGRTHFDLPGYVAAHLAKAGVSIEGRSALCTYENESLFFSFRRTTHRKEPDYGRQISAIVLD